VVVKLPLLKQIVHQNPDQVCLFREPGKTRLKRWAITALPFRQAGVAQPVGHAAQGVEQITQLPGYPVAAGAQTQITDRTRHAFGWQQRLTWLDQNKLLLCRVGTTQQVDDAACLLGRQRLAAYRGQDRRLVAHGQPGQRPRQTRRQQAQA